MEPEPTRIADATATRPFLSVVLPAYSGGAHLVARTLHSYAGQRDLAMFEVLVVDDGALDDRVREVAHRDWPFAVRYLVSPRVRDESQAHKNHARNVGWRHAAGDLVFMVDCDCMAPPDFVERVVATYEAARGDRPVVLYPLIQNLHQRFNDWIDRHGDEALRARFAECVEEVGKGAAAFGGYLEKFRDEAGSFAEIAKHAEGFQILTKRLMDQLGGFDEDFLAWGANKEEFQQRINEVGAIKKLLATSCVVYHQPHPKSRDNKKLPGNAGLMHGKARERRKDTTWKARVEEIEGLAHEPSAQVVQWRTHGQADLERLAPAGTDRRIVKVKRSDRYPLCQRVLFVGPWVGEFGWQCCRWQGGVRKLVQDAADQPYVIVMGDPGCHPFYEYADEYWWTPPFVGRQGLTRNMTGWLEKAEVVSRALRAAIAEELSTFGPHIDVVEPRRFKAQDQAHVALDGGEAARAELTLLTRTWGASPWVCLFPRARALNPEKNWAPELWERLAEHLHHTHGYRVVVCGGKGDTAKLDLDPCWALDLTGIPLERRLALTIAFLGDAHAAVASESGGCQLALLCGTPTVVMGGTTWEKRVTADENYLAAPCRFLARPGYRHSYESVVEAVDATLAERPVPPDQPAAPFRRSISLAEKVAERLDPEPVLGALWALPHVPDRDRRQPWFKGANYYPHLAALTAFIQPERVLEIGTRYGYGLVAMTHGHAGIERVVAVDDESEVDGSQAMALENLRSAGYEGSADLLVGDGLEGLDALLRYERFDLVYLDADVSREEVEESIRRGWALLKPGGYLLVDDVDYTSEVGRAFEGQRGRFQDAQFTQRLGTFRGLGVMRKMPAACPPEQAVEHACAVCDGELTRMPDHDGMRLLRCVGCHLIQVDLSDPEVRGAWAGYYTESGAYHRERQLAGHESFLHRYLHDRELGRLRIENLLRYAEPGRLLDVGCSNGALVREAAEAGFDAEGIDVDPWVVHEGARLSGCRLAACNPLAWEGGPYDVITVIDVFEHFPTPREHLAKLRNLLKPGGLLVLEMPDAGQGGVERLGVAWRHFKPREHAFLYAKEHTHRLLAEGGFEVVDSVVPYPDRRVDYARRV